MPGRQRGRRDREDLTPALPRDQPGKDGQPDPVGGLIADRIWWRSTAFSCRSASTSASLATRLRSTAAGTLIRFRTSAVTIDSGIEGSSQAPRRPLPHTEKPQAKPRIVFPSGTGRAEFGRPAVTEEDITKARDRRQYASSTSTTCGKAAASPCSRSRHWTRWPRSLLHRPAKWPSAPQGLRPSPASAPNCPRRGTAHERSRPSTAAAHASGAARSCRPAQLNRQPPHPCARPHPAGGHAQAPGGTLSRRARGRGKTPAPGSGPSNSSPAEHCCLAARITLRTGIRLSRRRHAGREGQTCTGTFSVFSAFSAPVVSVAGDVSVAASFVLSAAGTAV